MKKYYTESELKSFNLEQTQLDSIAHHKDRLQEKLNELKKYVPEADLYYRVSEYDGKKHIENGYICFEREGILFFHSQHYKTKKDYFFTEYTQFNNVSYDDILPIKQTKKQPDYIGTYTQRKVDAWIEYLTQVYNDVAKLNTEREEKINTFLKDLENEDVHWFIKGKSGSVHKNGLSFTFTIDRGFIGTSLSLDYRVRATLKHFRALSENQFRI